MKKVEYAIRDSIWLQNWRKQGVSIEVPLNVWQVKKVYLPAWSGAGDSYDDGAPPPPQTALVDGSGVDPVLGADYAQIGQWSRRFHATQGMGVWVEPGQNHFWPLNLAWSAAGEPTKESDIFQDLPQHLGELSACAGAPELSDLLGQAQSELDASIKGWPDRNIVGQHAAAALRLIRRAAKQCPDGAKSEILHRLEAKERQLSKVLALASNIKCTVALSKTEARPGDSMIAELHLSSPETDVGAQLVAPDGWIAGPMQNGACEILLPDDVIPSSPYPDTWFPDRANGPLHLRLNWRHEG